MVATAESAKEAAPRRPAFRSHGIQWLILFAYLVAAFVLTIHIWSDPRIMATTSFENSKLVTNDILVDVWFMRYAEMALAHGHIPSLITHAVNSPQGINLMWNNALLLPGIVLAPITALAGPVASLAVLETLGFAGSAAAMFLVLRRWGVSIGAAGLGGAIYAFSPALMVAAEDHLQLQFAVLPPLIVDAALRLATGRARPLRTGIWLGVLVSLQVFIGEEELMLTAIAGVVLLIVLALHRPAEVLKQARDTGLGLLVALGVVFVVCGYALLTQLRGPLVESGSPFHTYHYGNHEAAFFTAPLADAFHSSLGQYISFMHQISSWPVENYAYLGWPLFIGLIVIAAVFWRDLRIRVAALTFLILLVFSMGGHQAWVFGQSIPARYMPWHYIGKLPLVSQIVVTRLSIMMDGVLAVIIAFAADRVYAAVKSQQDWRKPVLAAVSFCAFGAMLVPILPRPVPAAAISQPPPGWQHVVARLHLKPTQSVLVLPLNGAGAMGWQAFTGENISLVGGYCIAPTLVTHQAAECEDKNVWNGGEKYVAERLAWLWDVPPKIGGQPSKTSLLRVLQKQWKTSAIIVYPSHPLLVGYLTQMLGRPTVQSHGVLAWRIPKRGAPH